MKFSLQLLNKSGTGDSFEFDKSEITIGRVKDNDLMLDDLSVSRNHAKIVERNGTFELIDLESKNGIKHCGKQVQSAPLRDQDVIAVGNVTMQFLCPGLSVQQEVRSDEDATVVMGREDATIIMGNYNISPHQPKLVVIAGDAPGREYIINKGVLTIGRSAENDISINDSRVSRQHAKIFLQNDGSVTIKDMGSGNGTFISGRKINEAALSSGDEITIGNMTLRFAGKGDDFTFKKETFQTKAASAGLGALPRVGLIAVLLIGAGLAGFFLLSKNDTGDAPERNVTDAAPQATQSPGQAGGLSVITEAIDMYSLGQTDSALSLLRGIQNNSTGTEWTQTAGNYVQAIEDVKTSFEQGNSLYKENNIEGAFAEWKNTLTYEKKLPLTKKSWFSKQISYNAADELYRKGVERSIQGDKDAAINSWVKALQVAPEHKAALSRLEGIAKSLYEEAAALGETDRAAAVRKLEEILTLVPEGTEYYEKALSKLNEG